MARITKTQLIKLQKRLKTDAAIGEQFGITRQAIHQLRKKYGIESRIVQNAARNDEIVNLYRTGMSGTALSKKFKLSVSQTYRIINDAEKSSAKAAKKSTKKVAKKPAAKVVKKPAAKVAKKPAAKVAKKPAAKAAKKPAKKAGKKKR